MDSSDRKQGFISVKLPWCKMHAAACFCVSYKDRFNAHP
jgi:hypothetical protein